MAVPFETCGYNKAYKNEGVKGVKKCRSWGII